jgi:hypothetical protein
MNVRTRWSSFRRILRRAWVEYESDYARYFAGAIVDYALVSPADRRNLPIQASIPSAASPPH